MGTHKLFSGITDFNENIAGGGVNLEIEDYYMALTNTSDQGQIASGAMMWTLSRCVETCQSFVSVDINLSGLPTLRVTHANFNRSLPDMVYDMAFLICSPNAVYETREVRNDGHGRLTVLDKSYSLRQGNLDPTQTNIMFSTAMSKLGKTAGPVSQNSFVLGAESQSVLIFGPNATNLTDTSFNGPATILQPAPLDNVTASYSRMLQSASKVFLSGSISKAYVPGRFSTEQVIFTSSLPQVIVSTILFTLLCIVAVMTHFRRTIPQFTLFSVAASLDGSDVPRVLGQVRSDYPNVREPDMVATLGGRLVTAGVGGNGSVLYLQ